MRFVSLTVAALGVPAVLAAQAGRITPCAANNAGLTLPAGFCATLFADSLPAPRQMVVAPNGDVFVATQGRRGGAPGGIVALRDENGDGRADRRAHFGDFRASAVALFDGHVYTENSTAILRFPIADGALEPNGPMQTVVADLPGLGHSAKTFVIGRDGSLYVNVGSRTNACQEKDRTAGSPGANPCLELETRAGIWRFDARTQGQAQSAGEHFASGIRNAVAIAFDPVDNTLVVMQHGRDQLGGPTGNWAQLFNEEQSAEIPAEEMFRVQKGDDFGWPYCYFDPIQKKKVLAPEYGGDGKTVGQCANKKSNVAFFPAHWAPNGLLFYSGRMLPTKYRTGAFVVFHGSWNRAPLPQQGFRVVFQPLHEGKADGAYETFAEGFQAINGRPTGIAQAPDGALYISDDLGGRIWRVVYRGSN